MTEYIRTGSEADRTDATASSSLYRSWILCLLLLAYTSSYIDRSVLGILQDAVKREMGLSDGQLGLLGGLSFALFYTLLAVPIARLAERRSRTMIVGISLVIWSGMTLLCGVAQNFTQLFLCRMGVGIGEAGGNPPSHSLISDLYPAEKRASALAIFSLGAPLGALIGAALGGVVAQGLGWRGAFFVLGPVGLVIALLMTLTVREPARIESAAGADPAVPSLWNVSRLLIASPVFRNLAMGAALIVLGGYCVALFSAPFFLRLFHLSLARVGLISGLINGVAAGGGTLIGGFLTDRLARQDRRLYMWVPAACVLIAGPIYAIAFLQPGWKLAALMLMPPTLLIYTYFAPTFAVLQSLVESRMRATAAAILFMVINLVGVGFGPPLIGFASDHFAAAAFAAHHLGAYAATCPNGVAPTNLPAAILDACAQASAIGLRNALILCSAIFVWAAFHFARAGHHMRRA